MNLYPWDAPPMRPQRLVHPRDIWAAAKQIDGLGGEWTYQVFNHRALNFHLPTLPPHWAEPLSSFDSLYQEVWFQGFAVDAGVPLEYAGSATASFQVFRSVFSASSNEWPMPENGERIIGQHSVPIVGIADQDTLLFQHGWSDWPKDHAIGRLTRNYIESYGTELWVNRPVGCGPRAVTVEELVATTGTSDFARIWRSSGRRGIEDIGRDLQVRWWEAFSLEVGYPAEVLCLTAERYLRVAVAYVIYEPTVTAIIDLFVWPGYRRCGYATLLEAIITRRARMNGSEQLSIIVLDADVVNGRTAAVSFLESCGYEITEYTDHQVQIYGVRHVGHMSDSDSDFSPRPE
jgi:GNAT superfamily N-acetyltransferase